MQRILYTSKVTSPMYWRTIIPQCDLSFFFLLKSEDALISNHWQNCKTFCKGQQFADGNEQYWNLCLIQWCETVLTRSIRIKNRYKYLTNALFLLPLLLFKQLSVATVILRKRISFCLKANMNVVVSLNKIGKLVRIQIKCGFYFLYIFSNPSAFWKI